ncbi:unnamed protein product [Euphydryas editha]|uniref:Transposable element P transposase n=1 Tax=Euphydryas editha TaxID=104508 RepID=A0AAU9TK24_EUPED|nr:unnamed protein product [Euphydryas editha]
MFALPGQSCLDKLLNCVPLKPGINKHLFESLKKMAQKQTDEDNISLLLFDEMSIRKHLHYNCKLEQIQGFQDHGNHGRNEQIATKALVFMLTGLRKKWKQPIAFYFSHALTADRMTVILKEILIECFDSGINVVATVCDLSTVNIKVLRTLGATTREPYFSLAGREIVAILDPPHLLKCTRNLVMKHDVECTTDFQCSDQIIKGIVKWSHIKKFYNLDKNNPNFVYAPALTDQHINPNVKQQMRVKLAAQVFSHSIAAGLLVKIAKNELPNEAHATASFVSKFDELFDAVNADSPDLRRGKRHSTNLTSRSPHIALFNEMRRFISSMKYLGSKTIPPSQQGWIHTLNAIERLWNNLQAKNIKSLSTRRLNQDPLENCFGCIRYNCGCNYNPTIEQFVAGVKTA